jgi:hypothetical protein
MDLKPLHEIVKPGVPCEVECRDTYLFRCRYDGETFDSVISFIEGIRPIWRLAPPAPLLTWEPDPEAFRSGEYAIRNERDSSAYPWLVKHWPSVECDWFATRGECEKWAETHARANAK